MAYAALVDLQIRYGEAEILQLSDRDSDGGHDSGVIDAALADASGEMDGYLSVRYSLPLAQVPIMLSRICCDIARYRLWSDDATDQIRKRYEDAIADLGKIASGAIQLPLGDDDAAAVVPATPGSRVVYFTDEALGDMPI